MQTHSVLCVRELSPSPNKTKLKVKAASLYIDGVTAYVKLHANSQVLAQDLHE
jgi:hypothetical protein